MGSSSSDRSDNLAGVQCEMHRRIEEELIRGRDMANQLKILLQNPSDENENNYNYSSESAQNILRSFSQAISLIAAGTAAQPLPPPPPAKDRRGCYKRRKGADSWEKISTTTEDNYAWRKYGQKKIHNSYHPRCYYRCTNKYAESCNAVKQVQQISGEKLLYHITYIGNHTCQDTTTLRTPSSIIFDNSDDVANFSLTGFESTMVNPSLVKEEAHDSCASEPLDSIVWSTNIVLSDAPEYEAFDTELIY